MCIELCCERSLTRVYIHLSVYCFVVAAHLSGHKSIVNFSRLHSVESTLLTGQTRQAIENSPYFSKDLAFPCILSLKLSPLLANFAQLRVTSPLCLVVTIRWPSHVVYCTNFQCRTTMWTLNFQYRTTRQDLGRRPNTHDVHKCAQILTHRWSCEAMIFPKN